MYTPGCGIARAAGRPWARSLPLGGHATPHPQASQCGDWVGYTKGQSATPPPPRGAPPVTGACALGTGDRSFQKCPPPGAPPGVPLDSKAKDQIYFKSPMGRLKAISLFSGCGGSDLALERAGFKIVWSNDIRNFLFGLPAIENIHPSASQRVQCFLREDHRLRASLSGSPKTVQSASKPSFFRQLSIPGG